jgi:predicted  nucleic acid-binding Zn-ribbon protein
MPPLTAPTNSTAPDRAQRLAHQLRAAEARIAELEAERQAYQQRIERAEQWLVRIYTEIEDRLLKSDDRRNVVTGGPRRKG